MRVQGNAGGEREEAGEWGAGECGLGEGGGRGIGARECG